MPFCGKNFGKNYMGLVQRRILVEVAHVGAAPHKKRKSKICRILKSLSLKAIEKADELAKEGAMLDEGFVAEARAETVQQERDEVYAALQ